MNAVETDFQKFASEAASSVNPLSPFGERVGVRGLRTIEDLNPSPHPSPYGRGSRPSPLPRQIKPPPTVPAPTTLELPQKDTQAGRTIVMTDCCLKRPL